MRWIKEWWRRQCWEQEMAVERARRRKMARLRARMEKKYGKYGSFRAQLFEEKERSYALSRWERRVRRL